MSPRQTEANEELKAKQRERILNAAAPVFARHGFLGTKVTDIAAAAGCLTRRGHCLCFNMETHSVWLSLLLSGLGIGSIFKGVMDYFLGRRSMTNARLYQEKKEAYLGLLNSLHAAAVEPSDANSKQFALWQTRVELSGDDQGQVAEAVQGIIDTNNGPTDRRQGYFRQMIDGMRRDLRSS